MHNGNAINDTALYILENMPMIVDALDNEGNIVIWNKEAERVTGYTKEEIIKTLKPLSFYIQMISIENMC